MTNRISKVASGKAERGSGQPLLASSPVPLQAQFAADLALTAREGELPARVMWMPGGLQEITASQGGRPVSLWVDVGPETAAVAQRALEAHRAASPHRPFFDLDHLNQAATAWPVRFEWANAPAPGVYAAVEWSEAGRTAVLGKTHRAFSPGFFTDTVKTTRTAPARVTGAPLNMGGLVNNPAFKRILPFFAHQATHAATHDMKKHQQLLALLGAIATLQQERTTLAADATKADALKAMDGEITAKLREATDLQAEIQAADAAGRTDAADALAAKEAELKLIQAKATQLEAEKADRQRADAKALVKAAVERGAIAAQDTATQAEWETLLAADPTKAGLLAKLAGNPALGGAVITAGARVETGEGDVTRALEAYGQETDPQKRAALWAKDLRPRVEKGNDLVEPVQAITRKVMAGGYAIQAANSLGTLTGVLTVQRALDYLKLAFPLLSRISTDYSAEGAKFNQQVMTRLRGNLTLQSFNPATGYVDQDAATTDVPVTIDQHRYVQIAFGVNELASTMRGLFDEQEEPMHYTLGKGLVDYVYALITAGNFANATTQALVGFARATVVDIASAVRGRGVVGPNMSLLLNSAYFGALSKDSVLINLATQQAAQSSLITAGTLPDISGLRPIEAINLPTTGNLTGFALRPDALALATRVPNDYTTALPGVPSTGRVQVVTNPDTGISVLLTQYVDHNFGAARGRVALMFGAARGQAASGQRLISA